MSDAIVSVRNVSRRYGGGVIAVDNVSLDIAQNEFFALLGPSGCGKTTLLRMISGLDTPTEGQIFIGGEDMALTPPNKRPTNMVFQSYAVFPHMTVAQNVAYGLKVTGVASDEIKRRVAEGLEMSLPALVVSKQDKSLRDKKVLIDWSQNVRAKTTVCAYSLRARNEPTVSTPVRWDEVEAAAATGELRFTWDETLARVEAMGDLFA